MGVSGISLTQDDCPRDEDLLSPTVAAAVAGRSVRTIRRAYRAGALVAYRDGNGRGVRIRYDDLRDWMMARVVVTPTRADGRNARLLPDAAQPQFDAPEVPAGMSENLALLNAARARLRQPGAERGGGAVGHAVDSPASRRA